LSELVVLFLERHLALTGSLSLDLAPCIALSAPADENAAAPRKLVRGQHCPRNCDR